MKCDIVDDIILWALVLTVIGDSLGLLAELLNRRCEKKDELECEKKEEKVNQELEDLRKRIALLERKTAQYEN